MKKALWLAVLSLVLAPAISWAGSAAPLQVVPTLGEAGLITLGVGLVGVGVVALRRKKR